MAESRYGRLFTEADVRGLIALALTDPLLPNHSVDPYEVADRILYNPQPPAVTFAADEPLFLLRGQGEIGSRESLEGLATFHRAARRWQAANPDRVKVPD